ncbi:hypothetical protein KL935_001120 [Ogataea polymorpha]|nr:hypothetical protein KL935_001120 [Ogataea polymorpha]KAG7911806.1 hypothetical protein KL906_000010 [Ogataea polymorpha]
MTQNQSEQISRLADFEYNYKFRFHERWSLSAATSNRAYFNEQKRCFFRKANVRSDLNYSHNAAYNGAIARILESVQVNFLSWPGMGSEVVFEPWEGRNDGESYLRAVYMGTVLTTTDPLVKTDILPLRDFVGYTESMIGKETYMLVNYCGSKKNVSSEFPELA